VKSHIAYTAVLRTVHAYSDLIVKTGVQDALDEDNAAADFYAALDEEVANLLKDAARRTEANDPENCRAARALSPARRLHNSLMRRRAMGADS
jgi:hypothetical protein